MKVVCVMCGAVVRELAPVDTSDVVSGVCPQCREKTGSTPRADVAAADPEVEREALAGRNEPA